MINPRRRAARRGLFMVNTISERLKGRQKGINGELIKIFSTLLLWPLYRGRSCQFHMPSQYCIAIGMTTAGYLTAPQVNQSSTQR